MSTSRRNLLFASASATVITGAKAGARHDVTQAPFNADPTGAIDSAGAFQSALDRISQAGRGVLYIPSGTYILAKPLICGNAALAIIGDGSASSVLVVTHAETALTVACNAMSQRASLRDIGFSPIGAAGTAIAITHPDQPSGWPGCLIENIDLGVPTPNYTCFQTGIAFTNLWRGHIENVNWHGNAGSVRTSRFAVLGGRCIDNHFRDCTIDGVGRAFVLAGYAEGLHITGCVVIGTSGLTTGPAPFSGNGVTTPFVNLLGLYLTGSEFNTSAASLDLHLVDTAWISDSHFSTRTSANPAVRITGSTLLHMNHCTITGHFDAKFPAPFQGIETVTTFEGTPTNGIVIDDCDFTNLSCAITYGAVTRNATATGVRMFSPGNASLIAAPLLVNGLTLRAVQDDSGNATNIVTNAPRLRAR